MTSNQPWWLAMPPAELAATILPLFSDQVRSVDEAMEAIVNWCRTGSFGVSPTKWFTVMKSGGRAFEDPDFGAIAEAMQVLEHAGLLVRALEARDVSYFKVGLTRLGWHTVRTNTVRQHLGLSDATSTT
jgi:hypothetical protein